MIFKSEMELYYLGDRDYVNGLTLFEESMRLISKCLNLETLSNILVQQFKMMKFIRTHAQLELYQLNDIAQRSRIRYACAMLDLTIEDKEYRALLFSGNDKERPMTVSSYDRSSYVKDAVHNDDGGSRAILHNALNSYELLRGIIEVNQRFATIHAPLIGIPASKFWAYMTGYRLIDSNKIPEEIKVEFHLRQVIPQKEAILIVRGVEMPSLADVSGFDLCFFART